MNIKIDTVSKQYGDVTALDGPSFEIPAGSTFGILGTNGAGKTTLFRLLVGHDVPDDGGISVGGINTADAGDAVRGRIGYLPEQVGFPGLLTGVEVLELHARVHGIDHVPERIDAVLETVGLADAGDRRVSGYSNGMRRRLGLAAALVPEPSVLVLDEPTAGLDPRGVESFHRIIERIDETTQATVIMTSHVLPEVERVCDRVAILHEGELCAVGSVEELTDESMATVHVSIRPESEDAREHICQIVDVFANVSAEQSKIALDIPRGRVFELLGALDSTMVRQLEVNEPGLDAVFHNAIGKTETVVVQ